MELGALNWKAGVALALLLAASLLVRELMPLSVLLFGFFLPGYLAIRIIRVELGPLALLAFSILASLLISTQLVYWLSMFAGYSSATIAASFLLSCAAALFVRGLPRGETEREEWQAAELASLSMLFVFIILYVSVWVPGKDGVFVGGWNYSDLFRHLGIILSVNAGNFPPQDPMFAGEPLSYHWFIDLHTAFVSELLATFPVSTIVFENALGSFLLSAFSYLLAFHFTRSSTASLLTAVLVVFGGGFGYYNLIKDAGEAPIMQLISSKSYDNDWEFFQIPSVLGGYMLVQRPQIVGIPALAAVLLLVCSSYPSSRRGLLLAGLLLGLLAPFQYHAFLAAAILSALYIATCEAGGLLRGRMPDPGPAIHLIVPATALALPFLLQAWQISGSMMRFAPGWVAPTTSIVDFAVFYIANLGLPLLLAVPGYLFGGVRKKRFLALWAGAMFALPNLVSLSNTQWDMAKFFTYMWFPLCVLAAAALARVKWWLWPFAILLSTLSPLLVATFFYTSGWVGLSYEEISAGVWISENTPRGAVFATSTSHNTPVDSVGGRLRILGYKGWAKNYGFSIGEREADLHAIYCGPADDIPDLMRKYGASYIYLGPAERSEFACPYRFRDSRLFERVFENDAVEIYKLR